MKNIPFIAFGNDELDQMPRVLEGDKIKCPHCKKKHILKCANKLVDGKKIKSDVLMFYKCGKESYLAAIKGKLLP